MHPHSIKHSQIKHLEEGNNTSPICGYIFSTIALILLHNFSWKFIANFIWQPAICQSANQDSATAHTKENVSLA